MNIAEIQRALLARGYDPGPVDGIAGEMTRKAVRAFQKDCGLVTDGAIGPATRKALASAAPTVPPGSDPPRKAGRMIHILVWHCTATPADKEFTPAEIDRMHRARGFIGIGYHKLVHLDGSVSEGRPEAQVGAHVAGHNAGSLGYAYVGGVDAKGRAKDTRTPAQKAAMIRLTREAAARYALRAVVGHRDLSPDLDGDGAVEPHEWAKHCPCFDAIPEYRPLLRSTS